MIGKERFGRCREQTYRDEVEIMREKQRTSIHEEKQKVNEQ